MRALKFLTGLGWVVDAHMVLPSVIILLLSCAVVPAYYTVVATWNAVAIVCDKLLLSCGIAALCAT